MRWCVLLLSLPQAGCLLQTITTEVELHDPSAVAVTASGSTVIAAGSGPSVQKLASGRAEVSDSSNAGYDVSARREADGSLWVEWTTTLPLAGGERYKVLGRDPLVWSKPLAEIFSKTMLDAPSFVLPMCTTIASRSSYYAHHYSSHWAVEAHAVGGGCDGVAIVPYEIETPWSNVVIHEKTRVDHTLAWTTVLLSALALAPFAIIVDATSPSKIAGGFPTQVAFTVGIAAAILAFDGAMIPTLVTPDRDVYVRK
jgi:hypothetical protein